MRNRFAATVGAVALLLPGSTVAGAGPVSAPGDPTVFAGGGTNLTNGIFFPGTTFYDSEAKEFTLIGPPLEVQKGQDVEFVNLDVAALTNAHRIRSFDVHKKGKKKGKPLFQSEELAGPGTTTMKMKKVKVGTYLYLCTTHSGMFGTIEVVEPGS